MRAICPRCQSFNAIRIVHNQNVQGVNQSLASSISFATLGTALSKTLPITPLIGGVAGAVVGGLLSGILGSSGATMPSMYFQCQDCGEVFL